MVKVAVIIHLFHDDLIYEFYDYFKQFNVTHDLYISAQVGKTDIIKGVFPHATIIEVENVGTDFYPFTSVFNDIIKTYDLVLKIHTKKTEYLDDFQGWRHHLLNNLMCNPTKIVELFEDNPNLGILYPDTYYKLLNSVAWGSNYENALEVLKLIDVPSTVINSRVVPSYPVGSMFWFRPRALIQIIDGNITKSTYQTYNGFHVKIGDRIVDGSIAHALERLVTVIAIFNGYEFKLHTPIHSCTLRKLLFYKFLYLTYIGRFIYTFIKIIYK